MAFSRDNAKTIQWKNIDYENLWEIADSAWLHPSLKP